MTAGSAVSWIGEGDDYGDTQPTFDQPQMTPHDLSARTDITRRLLLQSTPDAEAIVRADLALRIGIGIDLGAIAGSGSSHQPTGLLNVSGLPTVALGTNGAAPTWNALTQVVQAVATANGLRGSLGWIVNGAGMGTLMRTPYVSTYPRYLWEAGQEPNEGMLAGYRARVSNNVPGNLTKGSGTNLSALLFGNWSEILVAQWRGIDMLIDPYSQSSTGTVRITAIQTVDVLVRHVASFCAIGDAITT
jgi:HK97 family phage major capsid protein